MGKKSALLAIALPLACMLLLSPFAGTDAPWPPSKFAGVWLAAALAVMSVWGWGSVCAEKISWGLEFAPPLGALAIGFFIFLAGTIGWIGPNFVWLFAPLFSLGVFFFFDRGRIPWRNLWPLALLLPFALLPQNHPDPLYYHLLAPRRWYEAGRIFLDPDHPLLFLTGLWDLLFLWPIAWLPLQSGQELILQQIAGQCLTLCLGGGGFWLLARAIWLDLREKEAGWLGWLGMLSAWLLPVAALAKSDWGILLWLCAGARLLLQPPKKSPHAFVWAGIFMGAAVTCKWPSAFAATTLAIFLLSRLGWRAIPYFAAGGLAGIAPVALRNMHWAKDPFFPVFRSPLLSEADILLHTTAAPQFHADIAFLAENLSRFFLIQPFCALALLYPFLWPRLSPAAKKNSAWAFAALLGFTLLTGFSLHPAVSWRISLPLPLLWSIFAAWILGRGLERWPARRFVLGAVAAILFLQAMWPQLGNVRGWGAQPAEVIRDFPAGDAMAFVRLATPREKVAVGGNAQLFYLTGLPALTPESPARFSAPLRTQRPAEFVDFMLKENFRWFLETRTPQPAGKSSYLISALAEKFPAAVVFTGPRGRVIDLRELKQRIERSGDSLVLPAADPVLAPQQ